MCVSFALYRQYVPHVADVHSSGFFGFFLCAAGMQFMQFGSPDVSTDSSVRGNCYAQMVVYRHGKASEAGLTAVPGP